MDFSELLVLMVIALILFGPEDLPKIARATGKAVHSIRKLAQEFTRELRNTANDPVNIVNKALEYPQPKSTPAQTQNAGTEHTDKGKQDQELLKQDRELLTYEENNLLDNNVGRQDRDDPLAALPPGMVSYEEESASR